MKKLPLIILTGPTAVGKTSLSIQIAKAINGEIISADSMQVYKQMDIGSAKITKEEMQNIPHHLIDVLEPTEAFDVVLFQKLAKQAIYKIIEKGKIPIVTGGTGFYIQALLYDIDFTENEENHEYRVYLSQLVKEKGSGFLHEMLAEIDPESALLIHENNEKRVIRALEFHYLTGEKISNHNKEEFGKESPYNFLYFVLNDHRQQIYTQINQRVDQMLEQGLVDEVKRLLEYGCNKNNVSMQGLGYKEIISYLEGDLTLEEAVELIKRDTRHFAKRQLTWFRREKQVIWMSRDEFQYNNQSILTFIIEKIRQVIPC